MCLLLFYRFLPLLLLILWFIWGCLFWLWFFSFMMASLLIVFLYFLALRNNLLLLFTIFYLFAFLGLLGLLLIYRFNCFSLGSLFLINSIILTRLVIWNLICLFCNTIVTNLCDIFIFCFIKIEPFGIARFLRFANVAVGQFIVIL